jgi:hypothetical protein
MILAVLLAAVAAMVVGFLWYGPLFSKPWMQLIGIKKKDIDKAKMAGMWKIYLAAFALNIITALVIYTLLLWTKSPKMSPVLQGLELGFLAWMGFSAATIGQSYLFLQKPIKLYLIDAGHFLASYLVMGLIIGALA